MLIIIRGNSGSGKTTVAKALQKKIGPNTMLISHDIVRLDMLNVTGAEGVSRSLALIAELLKYGRRNSEVTIMEGIFPAKEYRSLFDIAVEEFGRDIRGFYYDLPFEETLKRHQTKPNRTDFGEKDMRRWWKEKDLLPMIPETILTRDVSMQDAVELIYKISFGDI